MLSDLRFVVTNALSSKKFLKNCGVRNDAAINKETRPIIGRLLCHANHQSNSRYVQLDDEHLHNAAQQIENAVERLLNVALIPSFTGRV